MVERLESLSRRPRISGRLALLIAFAILVGLGLAIVDRRVDDVLTDSLHSSAEQGAFATAQTLADFALDDEDLRTPELSAGARADLARQLQDASSVESARLWDREGGLVLDTAFEKSQTVPGEDVFEAFEGEAITELTSRAEERLEGVGGPSAADDEMNLIEVYLPLAAAGEEPRYVIEAFLPYKPAQGLIADAHRSLDILLAGTSILLWAVLVFLFVRAARRIVPPGRNHRIERRLRAALLADRIVAVYQPKVDIRTGVPAGVEALVRWDQPGRGLVAPGEFLPQIENSHAMHSLTRAVLDQALGQLASWRRQGLAIRSMAVNVPSISLLSPGFEDEVSAVLGRHRIPPAHLTLELTEASFIEQPDLAAERVARLRQLGVAVSIDDFGTRYSSLARLAGLEVSELKIDRAFVAGMRRNDADLAVVRMVIELGQSLGLDVVAEGIEVEADAEVLRGLGCTIGQGFLYARPMSGGDLARWCGDHAPGHTPSHSGNGAVKVPPVWAPGRPVAR